MVPAGFIKHIQRGEGERKHSRGPLTVSPELGGAALELSVVQLVCQSGRPREVYLFGLKIKNTLTRLFLVLFTDWKLISC